MTKTSNPNTTCTLQLSKENQKASQDKFQVAIMEAIDETLASFSNVDKQEIYTCLENAFKIKKQEIPYKFEEFTDAIKQVFGVGAKLIEIRTIEMLHKRFPDFMFYPKKSDVFFKEYVVSLRAYCNAYR